MSAMLHIILPLARLFNPSLVLVSAGFDAANGDLIGGYRVSPQGKADVAPTCVVCEV